MEPVTISEVNVYELLGRKEALINSLMAEISRLKKYEKEAKELFKMWDKEQK